MKIKELAEKAVNFIVETQVENDYICEQMDAEYCESHCKDHLRKECVLEFLEKVYKQKNRKNRF